MLNDLFPRRLDNSYEGHTLALWLFGFVLLVKVGMSVNSIFNGQAVAMSADAVPLDTFSPAAARMVVVDLAVWGVTLLSLCLVGILALARYRGMVPMMFVVFLLEQLGRKLVVTVMPIARSGTPRGATVNLVLLAAMIVGLAMSLWRSRSASALADRLASGQR